MIDLYFMMLIFPYLQCTNPDHKIWLVKVNAKVSKFLITAKKNVLKNVIFYCLFSNWNNYR